VLIGEESCGGISMISMDGSKECGPEVTQPMLDVYGVSADLAYAVFGNQVLKYDAGTWSEFATLSETVYAVWADAETIVAVGPRQSAFLKAGAADFTALENVPAGDYSAVWGTSATDLWLANRAQLVHYDGSDWETFTTPEAPGDGIWGDGERVYYRGGGLGRLDQTAETLIAASDVPYGRVRGLWGRSATEVFVAVRDPDFDQYACGGAFILWFDGTEFHRF
jgi:hypothetical protein